MSVRSDVTLGAYAADWLAARGRLKATSVDNLRTALEVHVTPRLGTRRVQDLTAEDIAWLWTELTERGKRAGQCRTSVTCAEHDCAPDQHDGLSPRSVAHVHAALRAVLAQAIEDELIVTNPADRKRAKDALPRRESMQESAERHEWRDEQARAFIEATVDERLGALWATMLGTGMRRGEALALRWEDVDVDEGTLRVRWSVTAVRGRIVESSPKTMRSRRTLVLGDDLVRVLTAHRKWQAEERLRLGPVWQDSGRVFSEEDGRTINPNRASRAFTRAANAADLPAIGLHGLRHTHASMLLRARVPITAVAQRLGHEDPSITLSTYTHAIPADDVEAANATGRVLFGAASA